MPSQTIDPAQVEAFQMRFLGDLNGAAAVLMTSLGHRVGLFDAMAGLAPSTSEGIATAAGLDERYVREWLGALTAAGIVELDAASGLYSLPAAHAACLTRGADENLAVTAQYIPVLAGVEDDIATCFREGGGVPYERFPRFHEVMAEESAQSVVAALDPHVLPLIEGIEARLEAGIDVLDVGCGSGRALIHLAERFSASRFVGYDLSNEAVGRARAEAARKGLRNLRFEARDATELGERTAFDLITTFDAVHDQAHPDRVLAGIREALRPEGVYLMQEIRGTSHHHHDKDNPFAPFLYTISCMHCMTVSLAQGGVGLGAMWGQEVARRMLTEAGFTRVDVHQLDHDIMNDWYVIRR